MKLNFRESTISSFINLESSPYLTLTAQAPLHLLAQNSFEAEGASMVLHPITREFYKERCRAVCDQVLASHVESAVARKFPVASAEALLFRTRLNFYLGLYGRTSSQLQDLKSLQDTRLAEWADYLLQLESYVLDCRSFRYQRSVYQTPFVNYLMQFLAMNSLVQERVSPDHLNSALENWIAYPGSEPVVGEARFLRYKSMVLSMSDQKEALENLNLQILDLFERVDPNNFLQAEAMRRLAFYWATRIYNLGKASLAYEAVRKMASIDRHCAAVHTLKGTCEEAMGLRQLILGSYQTAYSIAYVERDLCRDKIEGLKCGSSQPATPEELGEMWSTTRNHIASRIPQRVAFGLVRHSKVFQNFPAMWTFEPDLREDKPYWYRQATNALNVYSQKKDLFFQTCYFQSLQPTGFRERMTTSALQETGDIQRMDLGGKPFSITSLPSTSNAVDFMQSGLRISSLGNAMEAAYFSRIFLYFGLEKDAADTTSWVWNAEKWNPYHAFVAYTNLLLSYRSGLDGAYMTRCLEAFKRFPVCDETLRLRFMLCIQSGGYFGKLRDLPKVKFWHAQGQTLLQEILNSPSFSASEAALLHSRWYRFSSFVPHLEKNFTLLKQETDLYIQLGEEAIAKFDSPFTRENMYAVYETRARTAEALGKLDEAYHWFLKLRADVDSHDSKVEINLGDMQEKMGNLEIAFNHYHAAFEKHDPLNSLAAFKLGACQAKREHIWNSIYWLSRFEELNRQSSVTDKIGSLFKQAV